MFRSAIILLQSLESLIRLIKENEDESTNMFIWWRIWKMRNMLIFENNREHRIYLIKNVITDLKLWKEAMNINLKEEDNPQAVHEREREKRRQKKKF